MARRKMWRKKLGSRTRSGQPVMQHIIEKAMFDYNKKNLGANAPPPTGQEGGHQQGGGE